MLVVVSPAKRLDWAPVTGRALTQPVFQQDAIYLAGVAARLSKPALQKLMDISAPLAKLNQDRFRAFEPEPSPEATRPAALAFAGDTYQGLEAASLEPEELDRAQDHLRILSGLYGLLRPMDLIQPYRLEMGSRLKSKGVKSLYQYWGSRLAEALSEQATATGGDVLVNCASTEYFGAVDLSALRMRVVTPVFLEERNGEAKIISFFAKKARGAMARFIIQHRISDPEDLKDFDIGGYRFAPDASDSARLVFMRRDAGATEAAA